jgi:hypothetical protein
VRPSSVKLYFLNLRFTVYYRLYSKDDALKSNNPIYSNDRFIGRTLIKSITPPRNVASLKRHLWKIEGFDGTPACTLYLSFSEKAPAEDLTRLLLRGSLGSGSPELDPMALVVDTPQVEKRTLAETKAQANMLPEWPHEQRYGGRLFPVEHSNDNLCQSTIVYMTRGASSHRRRLLI